MSATPEVINANVVPRNKRTYGVHEWGDRYGNQGMEILSQRHISVRAIWAHNLFDSGNEKIRIDLIHYFNPEGISKRKIFVMVDSRLLESKRTLIKDYFSWCKMKKLLENYIIISFVANETKKTFEKITMIIIVAKQFEMKRRDKFVAIDNTLMTNIVRFVVAIYRRSTLYILILIDLVEIVYCYANDNKISINHLSNDEEIYREMFVLSYLSIVNFYDSSFLNSLDKFEIKRDLIKIVRIFVIKDDVLFLYVEANLNKMLVSIQEEEHLMIVVKLVAKATFKEPRKNLRREDDHLFIIKFDDKAIQAIEQVMGIPYDDVDSMVIGLALMFALSFLQRRLSSVDLERVLNLLEKTKLSICDETLEANAL